MKVQVVSHIYILVVIIRVLPIFSWLSVIVKAMSPTYILGLSMIVQAMSLSVFLWLSMMEHAVNPTCILVAEYDGTSYESYLYYCG
jgi:hypothetical protein